MSRDLRYALRMCLRAPGVTAVAVLALALGIGANTAIFTVVHAVLIERLPFREADRVVAVWETNPKRNGRSNTIAPANFLQWRDRADAFEQLSAFFDFTQNLTGSGQPEEIVAQAVTPDFFATLGVSPMLGRTFAPDEGPRGHDDFVVFSYGFWQRRFGGDPAIVGRTIQLNGSPTVVIGVMPPDVQLFLKTGSLTSKPAEIWLPFAFTAASREPRGRYMSAIGRLKPGVPIEQAQAQMSTIASTLTRQWPQFDTGWDVRLVPIHQELGGDLRRPLIVLMGAVAFVLLIACANVANLLLARGAAREREMAVRVALGAGRSRLVRQLLTESLMLGLFGGAAGLLVAQWMLAMLMAISPIDLTGLGHLTLNYSVLAFTAGVSVLTAVVSGVAPAFEGSRADVQESLKNGARQIGSSARNRRLRQGLVVAEIALAVALLAGAGLLLRTFASMRAVDPGFDAHDVLTARVSLPGAKYPEPAARTRFFEQAVNRLAAIPGVQSAGAITFLPFAGLGAATDFSIVGQPPAPPGQSPVVDVRVCDNGYFRTLRMPLIRGRLFTDRELHEKSDVVIINETMAREYFGGGGLGERVVINMSDTPPATTIVGVVGDIRYNDLVTQPRAMSFWPHAQLPSYSGMTFVVRGTGDAMALRPAVENAIHGLDAEQPLADVRTMDQWIARTLSQARFNALLLAVFAAVALLLSAIGIYGVMSYAVNLRTSEIGIRVALGAARQDILGLIVGNGIRLALVGLAIGIALALALSRTITALLFDVSGADPATFAAAALLLGGVAVFASYVPARRASRIEPVEALRTE